MASDGTVAGKLAAEAIEACRQSWAATCEQYEAELRKVSPVHTEAAALLRSRRFAYDVKQRSLKFADQALAELRVATKEIEAEITHKTVPPRGRDDLVGELRAAEVRTWLRRPKTERYKLVAQAIGAGDVVTVAAALERPVLAGLASEQAAMLNERWRRHAAPEELARLATLEKTAQRVMSAAQALERRYGESTIMPSYPARGGNAGGMTMRGPSGRSSRNRSPAWVNEWPAEVEPSDRTVAECRVCGGAGKARRRSGGVGRGETTAQPHPRRDRGGEDAGACR